MNTSYHAPQDIASALALLMEHREDALVVAGGTIVATLLRTPGSSSKHLVDIARIPGLRGIEHESDERLRIGAMTTCAELIASPLVGSQVPILAKAAQNLGGPQVRNLATVGGNIVFRSPHADLVPALLVLDAVVTLQARQGVRRVKLSDYLGEKPRTDELLTGVDFDVAPRGTALFGVGARRSLSVAVATVAVLLRAGKAGGWERVRIALGGVAPTPIRAVQAEKILIKAAGETFDQAARNAADAAREEAAPESDSWASAWYRRHLVGVLTRRALVEAEQQAVVA